MPFGKLFNKINNQSGRTMTEILGVIALIGVLSLTGLLGFNYAMENVRENETLNRAAKIIAGARTSYILQNHGDATKYYQPGDDIPSDSQEGDRRDKFEPQPINMHDVISNIGNDFAPDATYIIAPLKGPFKDGTEENVRIAVRVETPLAFTVRFDNLTKQACKKIVMAQNLGYSWAFEGTDGVTHWLDPTQVMDDTAAEALCDRVIGVAPQRESAARDLFLNNPFIKQAVAQNIANSGTLVLWFGPYSGEGPDDKGEYPLCAGEDCCCELDADGNKYPIGKAGCKRPSYGTCVECTVENSEGYCVQRDDKQCPAENICHVSKCKSYQFECGKNCCLKGQTCENGVCKGEPDPGFCMDGQKECGDICCEADEICNADGVCEKDLCPASEGYHWCIQDELCCAPNETCKNGECSTACPSDQIACGDECCPSGHECKQSGGYFYCVPKCPEGETLYCSHDTNFVGDDPKAGGTSEYKMCTIYHSDCDEWACTKAPLILKDPNTPEKRDREVPIDLEGKYAYCAVVINDKCAVVTYCDEKPIQLDGPLEMCPTCFEESWSEKDFNPAGQICVGNEIKDIEELIDTEDALMMFRCDGCIVPTECPPGPPIPPCEDACPEGQMPSAGGICCDEGSGWGACGHCATWPTFTDKCGRTYPVSDICCPGKTSAPPGCTGLGNGECYANYPINNRSQCCALACAAEGGGEKCCTPNDAYQGVCCDSPDPFTQGCCTFKGRTWCESKDGGACCKEDEECTDGECKSTKDKECEDAGGVSGYSDVPEASQAKDKDGNPIDGCCLEDYACPDECCNATKQKCCKGNCPK